MKRTEEIVSEAVEALRGGGVILYPTDTVWGIGCDATDPQAVAKVYALKRRQDSKSLVLLASDMDMVARYVKQIPPMAIDLVEVNDKPMTLIYPGAVCGAAPAEGEAARGDRYHLAYNVVAEDGSAGIRIPMTDFCRQLAFKLRHPLVSTSANISGEAAPRSFHEIPQEIKEGVDYIVDARMERGATGRPSQIIKVGMDGTVQIVRQ